MNLEEVGKVALIDAKVNLDYPGSQREKEQTLSFLKNCIELDCFTLEELKDHWNSLHQRKEKIPSHIADLKNFMEKKISPA